jgi:hypothetical protein
MAENYSFSHIWLSGFLDYCVLACASLAFGLYILSTVIEFFFTINPSKKGGRLVELTWFLRREIRNHTKDLFGCFFLVSLNSDPI